jgi:four helix bundle protein
MADGRLPIVTPVALEDTAKQFGLEIVKLVDTLPKSTTGCAIGKQVVRAGTAVGANDRPACHAISRTESVVEPDVVIEEADECVHWFELIMDGKLLPRTQGEPPYQEANELASIFVASVQAAKNQQLAIGDPKYNVGSFRISTSGAKRPRNRRRLRHDEQEREAAARRDRALPD